MTCAFEITKHSFKASTIYRFNDFLENLIGIQKIGSGNNLSSCEIPSDRTVKHPPEGLRSNIKKFQVPYTNL